MNWQLLRRWHRLYKICRKIERDPLAKSYTDRALTPVAGDEVGELELYTQNDAARTAVVRELRSAGRPLGQRPAAAAE
jgi:hypothetical protein